MLFINGIELFIELYLAIRSAVKSTVVVRVYSSGIRGSAVCAFTLSEIDRSFEGAFKQQKTPHSNWLPVPDKDVPQPHPALVSSTLVS